MIQLSNLNFGFALILSGLTAAASAADWEIQKEVLGSDHRPSDLATRNTTALIMSNDEMEDFVEKVRSLEDSGSLVKGISERVQNEVKKKENFLICY